MISGTITDLSGRTLVRPDAGGLLEFAAPREAVFHRPNCALGAREMRAHIAELSRIADTLICAYPNAGLPNEFGLYDESPEAMAELVGEFADSRPRQYRRRLLRHDARPYPRHRQACRRRRAAQNSRRSRRCCGSRAWSLSR